MPIVITPTYRYEVMDSSERTIAKCVLLADAVAIAENHRNQLAVIRDEVECVFLYRHTREVVEYRN